VMGAALDVLRQAAATLAIAKEAPNVGL